METTATAALDGLALVFSWPNILYPVAGTALSMAVSLLPGISGVALMSIMIPLTLDLSPVEIMLLFGALVGGSTFAGSITAILFNIPGRNSNAATTFDGHPLARAGEAKTAIGCAAAASALGSTFGVGVLIVLLPTLSTVALMFGSAELLVILLWGISTIIFLSRDSRIKGWAIAGVGFLVAFTGADPRTAESRFTFGIDYLQDGLSLVIVFIGLFAIAESIEMMQSRRTNLSGVAGRSRLTGSTGRGIRSVFTHFGTFIRSSLTGTLIGVIPGVGGSVASFVAYANEARRRPDSFGKGDIRGVIAPEAANDAKDGGALVPTLALGIPGGMGTAMLLAALTLHGIAPGAALLSDNLTLVFVLTWSLFLSNWLTSLIGLLLAAPLAALTVVPTRRIVPVILVLASLAAYLYRGSALDVLVACGFGFAGYAMKRHGWPRIPFVIAMVLAPELERYLYISMRLHDLGRIDFWTRPLVIAALLALTLALLVPARRHLVGRYREMQRGG